MDGDNLLSTQAEPKAHTLSFYENLCTKDDQVAANLDARQECFWHLKQTITEEHNIKLPWLLTMAEVPIAMKKLPVSKSLGINSIPVEFYQKMWDDINIDIFNFVLEVISQFFFTNKLNVTKVALFSKTKERFRVQNFRPISFLNTLYKIVAKVYANRMKPLLHL